MAAKDLISLRHHLHHIAEISGSEVQTAQFIRETLTSFHPNELITDVGGHGIIARFGDKSRGPSVLIRCELDALPIAETNDLEYVSKNKKVGHKCGHDGHMAIVCGVAEALSQHERINGEVLLLFQPAEETGAGANQMLNDQRFDTIDPDYVFALHNVPTYAKGSIILRSGPFAAASVGIATTLEGQTAHAAHPEQGRSPALAVAQLISSLSALPQFYAPITKGAKVTVVQAELGDTAFGISPGAGEVKATLRTYDDDLLTQLVSQARAIAQKTAETFGLKIKVEEHEPFAATINDKKMVEILRSAAQHYKFKIIDKEAPFGWSEDFGRFTNARPGAMFGLGAGVDHPALHAPDYDFPDGIIDYGVRMFTAVVEQIMQKK